MSAPARRRTPGAAGSTASGPVVAAAATGDVQGAMLDAPSAANKNWVRLLAVSGEQRLRLLVISLYKQPGSCLLA